MTDEIIVKFDKESNIYILELSQEKFKALRECLHYANVMHDHLTDVVNKKKRHLEEAVSGEEVRLALQHEIAGITAILDNYYEPAEKIVRLILY